jgi:hypothetical protein
LFCLVFQVVPGLDALKKLTVGGQHVRARKYYPLEAQGDSEYDLGMAAISSEYDEAPNGTTYSDG